MSDVVCDMEQELKPNKLFNFGLVVLTPGVSSFYEDFCFLFHLCLIRHVNGDWGNLPAEDVEANKIALEIGGRLFSRYKLDDDFSESDLYIITEADRSRTTMLLTSEY